MKDFDSYIVDRWFWKFVEYGDINDFEQDVFKHWVAANGITGLPEDEGTVDELFELLQLGDLVDVLDDIEEPETKQYAIKLIEMEKLYLTSETNKMVDCLMTQLRNIKLPEEMK